MYKHVISGFFRKKMGGGSDIYMSLTKLKLKKMLNIKIPKSKQISKNYF